MFKYFSFILVVSMLIGCGSSSNSNGKDQSSGKADTQDSSGGESFNIAQQETQEAWRLSKTTEITRAGDNIGELTTEFSYDNYIVEVNAIGRYVFRYPDLYNFNFIEKDEGVVIYTPSYKMNENSEYEGIFPENITYKKIDSKGRVSYYESSIKRDGKLILRDVHKYIGDGNHIISAITKNYSYDDGSFIEEKKIINTYENSDLIKTEVYSDDDLKFYITATYDEHLIRDYHYTLVSKTATTKGSTAILGEDQKDIPYKIISNTFDTHYSYDDSGNIAEIKTIARDQEKIATYKYDSKNRLTNVTISWNGVNTFEGNYKYIDLKKDSLLHTQELLDAINSGSHGGLNNIVFGATLESGGYVKELTTKTYDPESGDSTSEIYQYEYDSNNNIIEVLNKSWENNELKKDSTIHAEYKKYTVHSPYIDKDFFLSQNGLASASLFPISFSHFYLPSI